MATSYLSKLPTGFDVTGQSSGLLQLISDKLFKHGCENTNINQGNQILVYDACIVRTPLLYGTGQHTYSLRQEKEEEESYLPIITTSVLALVTADSA